jgi:predicted transcriptional regulator
MVKLNKVDEQVLAALREEKELSLQEITEKTGQPSKKVFKSLRKLFENEMVDTKARKYMIINAGKAGFKTDSEDQKILDE